MARRRKKKRRNPSTAQWVVLGVGGAVGLGLVGYGVHLMVKNRRSAKQIAGAEGAAAPVVQWKYSITDTGSGNASFVATVYAPDGSKTDLDNYSSEQAADDGARSFILVRGGVPIRIPAGAPTPFKVVTGYATLS